jgi:hypothetical protein
MARQDGNFPGLARFEGALPSVQPQVPLAVIGVLPVAIKAIFGNNRTDFAIEIHRGVRLLRGTT